MFSAFDAVIFDLDGTLIDSAPGVMACLAETVGETGLAADESKLNRALIGPPLETMLRTLCPTESAEKTAAAVQVFRRIYDAAPTAGCSMIPAAERLLTGLRGQGKRLFVATNKPFKPAVALIDRLGLGWFEAVFAPDVTDGKRLTKTEMLQNLIADFDLDKKRAVMVGDAVSDMTAARAAGMKACAVLWGYEQDKGKLQKAADFVWSEE